MDALLERLDAMLRAPAPAPGLWFCGGQAQPGSCQTPVPRLQEACSFAGPGPGACILLREPWGAGAVVLGRRLAGLTGGAHAARVDRARIELLHQRRQAPHDVLVRKLPSAAVRPDGFEIRFNGKVLHAAEWPKGESTVVVDAIELPVGTGWFEVVCRDAEGDYGPYQVEVRPPS